MKKTAIGVVAILVAAGLSACGSGKNDPTQAGAVDLCQETVKAQMKDPNSVEFSGVTATESKAMNWTVYGLYNAKNGFGGYVGNQSFSCEINGRAGDPDPIYNMVDIEVATAD